MWEKATQLPSKDDIVSFFFSEWGRGGGGEMLFLDHRSATSVIWHAPPAQLSVAIKHEAQRRNTHVDEDDEE